MVSLNQSLYGEISTSDIVANQMEYPLPVDDTATTFGGGAIQVLRVETSYDATNWYVGKSTEIDIIRNAVNNTDINEDYVTTQPSYAIYDRSIWLLPVPTAAAVGGLKIYWIKRPDEIGTSSIPDLPKDFLGILADGILTDVYSILGRVAESDRSYQKYQLGIQDMKRLETQFEPVVIKASKNISNFG